MPVTKVLTAGIGEVDLRGIDAYRQRGGYKQWERAVREMQPVDVLNLADKSGLRGRGGAGFPTGRKWSFLPKDKHLRYLVCNCDEAEPGTFKDHMLLEETPHQVIEGMLIGAYAIASHHAFIYIRGEFRRGYEIFCAALEEAKRAGYVGKNIFGSGFDLELTVHRGAGAYICGEETALLNSLEGKRGEPRLKPPFPAVEGLYGMPTVVNNVETLAYLVPILERGARMVCRGRHGAEQGLQDRLRLRPRSQSGQLRDCVGDDDPRAHRDRGRPAAGAKAHGRSARRRFVGVRF